MSEIDLTRKYLKWKLKGNHINYEGNDIEWKQIYDLIFRTSDTGESNSALLIGPRGCGKTTMIRSILKELKTDTSFTKNTFIVELNGLIHTNDSLALEATAIQMELDTADTDGKVFGSFAENLLYLLDCLKSGDRTKSKSVIFLLEEFDLFCSHHNQTLLYNLFDVAQSAQAPICVIGITCRLDVIELLEKRVKSRFSHRQYFLYPNIDFSDRMVLVSKILTLPLKETEFPNYTLPKQWINQWNTHITNLCTTKKVESAIERLYHYETNIGATKLFLFELVSKLSAECQQITVDDIIKEIEKYQLDSKINLLCSLSVLEICLIITMKHHCEIYDRDPFNFEMILTRFNKFANSCGIFQNISRDVILKSFERIKDLEFILPVGTSSAAANMLKQFQMFWLNLTFGQINGAIARYEDLPTDIEQWSKCSLV